jgi:hypothetical protein
MLPTSCAKFHVSACFLRTATSGEKRGPCVQEANMKLSHVQQIRMECGFRLLELACPIRKSGPKSKCGYVERGGQ